MGAIGARERENDACIFGKGCDDAVANGMRERASNERMSLRHERNSSERRHDRHAKKRRIRDIVGKNTCLNGKIKLENGEKIG